MSKIPKPPYQPWSPDPDDDPVVREPQAKRAARVVVAFFDADTKEHSALSARDEAKAIGGVSVTVRLMTATFKERRGAIYVLLAETRSPARSSPEMGSIAKNLVHAPSVERVMVFDSSDAATRAVVKRVTGNWNLGISNLRLTTFDL